jgi:hypothetical protein
MFFAQADLDGDPPTYASGVVGLSACTNTLILLVKK